MATMGVPSASMNTAMDPKYPKVHMTLRGKLVDLGVKVDPKLYRKFVSTDC